MVFIPGRFWKLFQQYFIHPKAWHSLEGKFYALGDWHLITVIQTLKRLDGLQDMAMSSFSFGLVAAGAGGCCAGFGASQGGVLSLPNQRMGAYTELTTGTPSCVSTWWPLNPSGKISAQTGKSLTSFWRNSPIFAACLILIKRMLF